MILFEITNTEDHPQYQQLEAENIDRQYDFLKSIVFTAVGMDRPFLSQTIIKALNFQAIACLHTNAGEFRPCEVTVGDYEPPQHFRVPALMEDFVNTINFHAASLDGLVLAAWVLWRLNHIHPFINGNGRTARAACYYMLCVKSGGWLAGNPILPELIRQNRETCIKALRQVDESYDAGVFDLTPLHGLLSDLLGEQLNGVSLTEEPDAAGED